MVLHKIQHKDSLFITASCSKDNLGNSGISFFFFYIPTIVANIGRGHKGSFWGTDNVPGPDLSDSYTGVFIS